MRGEPTMRTWSLGALATVVLVLPAGGTLAQAPGWADHWRRTMRTAFDPGAMTEKSGKLYVVCEATLARVDLKGFEVEARVDLSKLGRDEEQDKKDREEWIARLDNNKDKVVDVLDGARWGWARRFDLNKDRKVTADEADIGPAPGAAGSATLAVVQGKLVMLRSGYIFRFDPATLELETTERILPPAPEPDEKGKDDKESKEDEDENETGEGRKRPEKEKAKRDDRPAAF